MMAGYWIMMAPHPSAAQLQPGFTQGSWVVGSTESCSSKPYRWSMDGVEMRFVDNRGNIDIEQVAGWTQGGFFSRTVKSSSEAQGTRWEYRVVGVDSVQVQNLSSGRGFVLNRCPVAAVASASQTAPAAPPLPANPNRIGPGFDCGKAKDALSGLICSSDQLSWLDLRFGQAYQALRLQVGEAGRPAVRAEAIDFQAQVYAECSLPKTGFVAVPSLPAAEACVSRAYQQQRNAWAARLLPSVQDEANRPLAEHLSLQAALQQQGYIPPMDPIDGVYGPSTRAAIVAWQQAHNLQPTGSLSASDARLLIPAEAVAVGAAAEPTRPQPDSKELQAGDERRLAIIRLETEKARADAARAQADANRARDEADVVRAKERAEALAARAAAERERSEKEAHGIQP